MTTQELRTIATEMAMEEKTDLYWCGDCVAGFVEEHPEVNEYEWVEVFKMRIKVSKFLQNKSYDEVIEMETEEVISKVFESAEQMTQQMTQDEFLREFGRDYNNIDEAIEAYEDEVAVDTSYRALKDERQAQRNFVGRYNQIPAYA